MGSQRCGRVGDWPIALSRFLDDYADKPFVWGENDCILFAASAVQALTGNDLAASWRGKYKSEAEARKILEKLGGLSTLVSKSLGVQGIPNMAAAKRGDVVLTMFNGVTGLGIVDDSGSKIAVMSIMGIRRIPLHHGRAFWSY